MFTLPPDRELRTSFDLISPFLALPMLRAFWPLNLIQSGTGLLYDLTPNALHLTANGGVTIQNNIYADFVSYADLDGINDYYNRTDEAALSITGALTYLGWFSTDTIAAGTGYIAVKGTGATNTDTFSLRRNTASLIAIVGSGTAENSLTSSVSLVASRWFFAALRYNPSTELALFHSGTFDKNTTSIITSLNDNASDLLLGQAGGASFWDGRIGLCTLCADDLPDALIQSLFAQTRHFFDV